MVQIYDKIFKKIITLSSKSVINLINGLYGTTYSEDSEITYNWTEFEDNGLKRTLADTILTIHDRERNRKCGYHMEAQTMADKSIILRVFEYGFQHALRNCVHNNNGCTITFPEPKIIYLYCGSDISEDYALTLDFGSQGTFHYHADTLILPSLTADELNCRKMVILIPFFLLKLRKSIEKKRTPENKAELQSLIKNDIIGSIRKNMEAGNITVADSRMLMTLTRKLYDYLYLHYDDMEDIEEMDQSLILENEDVIQEMYRLERIIAKKESILAEKENMIAEKQNIITEKQNMIAEKQNIIAEKQNIITEKQNIITEKDREIAALKARLAAIEKRS